MSLITSERLTKSFGPVKAIDGISFDIHGGEIVGLIGPDGAGKTTLIRLLLGLLRPSSGRLRIKGIDTSKSPYQIRSFTAYMPQHFSLYGDLTVAENMRFFADLYGIPAGDFEQKSVRLLSFSGLHPFRRRRAADLSGGMQKKLALACNLFHTPDILFLDEPTTGVDPVSRRELWGLLLELNSRGTTIVLSTPYMDEAQRCRRVGMMFEGRMTSMRTPDELIKDMKGEVLELVTDAPDARRVIGGMAGLKSAYPYGGSLHLVFEPGMGRADEVKNRLRKLGIPFKNVRRTRPSFEDAFLDLVQLSGPRNEP